MPKTTQTSWHITPLIAGNLFALILMLSWLFEPTRSLWLSLDSHTFWAMNNSLSWGETWQKIWAIANNRAFDLAAAIAMLGLFSHRALVDKKQRRNHYIALGMMLFLTLIVAMQLGKSIPVERPSATAVFPEALRLSALVPDISTKDYSGDSFPGDHGLVLLICAGFALFYLPPAYAALAILFSLLFTLPRLMSGAHWLTDEIVGAVAMASFVLSWLFATPLHMKLMTIFEKQVESIRQRLGR